MTHNQSKIKALVIVAMLIIVSTCMMPRFSQSIQYHNFADKRSLFNVSNFFDVVSNFPILLVGVLGLRGIIKNQFKYLSIQEKKLWMIFFGAVIFVSIFSAYYHLEPNNWRLTFDRLAISVVVMSFLSLIIYERVDQNLAVKLAPYLIFSGILSVIYWIFSENLDRGDLRFYALIQLGSVFIVLFIFALFPSKYKQQHCLYLAITCFALSKFSEGYDNEIFRFSCGWISGHSLKHFLSALSLYLVYFYLLKRKKIYFLDSFQK